MSRRQRRTSVKQIRRDMRKLGCTCQPRARSFTAGGWEVQHEVGCDFGDQMALLNSVGIMPAVVAPDRSCER